MRLCWTRSPPRCAPWRRSSACSTRCGRRSARTCVPSIATDRRAPHVDGGMTDPSAELAPAAAPRLRPPRHLVSDRAVAYWTVRALPGWLVLLSLQLVWLLATAGDGVLTGHVVG